MGNTVRLVHHLIGVSDLLLDATSGVEGHFDHPHGREWAKIQDRATPLLAEIVGKLSHKLHTFE